MQNLDGCGFGSIHKTQDDSRKSTCDYDEVSTVDRGVCGALGVLFQVVDEGEKGWRNVGNHGEEGVKFKRVSNCVFEVKSGVSWRWS